MKKNILFLIILSSSIASSVKADFKEDAQNFFRNMGGALRNTGRTLRNTATGTCDWLSKRLGLRQNNEERNINLTNNEDTIADLKQKILDQERARDITERALSREQYENYALLELKERLLSEKEELQKKINELQIKTLIQEAENTRIIELEEKLLKIEEDFKRSQSINEINKIEMIELNNINNDLQSKIALIENQKKLAEENQMTDEGNSFKARQETKLLEEENNNLKEKISYLEKENKNILEKLKKPNNSIN